MPFKVQISLAVNARAAKPDPEPFSLQDRRIVGQLSLSSIHERDNAHQTRQMSRTTKAQAVIQPTKGNGRHTRKTERRALPQRWGGAKGNRRTGVYALDRWNSRVGQQRRADRTLLGAHCVTASQLRSAPRHWCAHMPF